MAKKTLTPKQKTKATYLPDFSMRPSSGRLYAQKIASVQSKQTHLRVIVRAKALYGVILLALYFSGTVLHAVLSGHTLADVLGGPLTTANAALQVAASGYFMVTKSQSSAALMLQLLMIITGIQFFVGSFAYGSMALTLLSIGVQYYAYRQVSKLKYIGM